MSGDNSNNNGAGGRRRSSFASETFSSIFGRSTSGSQSGTQGESNGSAPVSNTPRPPRRMSITTLGLNTGTSPIQTSYFRRGSESTGESAIEDDDDTTPYAQSVPTTPFARRMSIGAGAMLANRGGTSPGATPGITPSSLPKIPAKQRVDAVSSSAPGSSFVTRHSSMSYPSKRSSLRSASISSQSQASTVITTRDISDISHARSGEGLNVYDHFRSRAQSSVMARPSMQGVGGSPNATAKPMTIDNDGKGYHERAKSISDMPEPPKAIPPPEQKPKREYIKPDQLGERMLRGEFLMD